jgi:hypothetical protein
MACTGHRGGDCIPSIGRDVAALHPAGNPRLESIRVPSPSMNRSTIIHGLVIILCWIICYLLPGCTVNDNNDVIDQAIAARIYNKK